MRVGAIDSRGMETVSVQRIRVVTLMYNTLYAVIRNQCILERFSFSSLSFFALLIWEEELFIVYVI